MLFLPVVFDVLPEGKLYFRDLLVSEIDIFVGGWWFLRRFQGDSRGSGVLRLDREYVSVSSLGYVLRLMSILPWMSLRRTH